jgi:two-component system, OmpR family, sensor kinase
MHIRTQMMLLYMLIFAILICLFGVVFFINLQSSLDANVDAELQEHAVDIASGIHDTGRRLTVQDVTGGLPGLVDADSESASPIKAAPTSVSTSPGSRQSLSANVDVGPVVRILDNKGTLIYISPAFQNLMVPLMSVTVALQDRPWVGTVTTVDGQQQVRLYSLPLVSDGSVYGIVQVGESLTSLGNTLRTAFIELIVIGLGVLLLALGVSYWLALRAFAPVKKMTSIARRIEAGDLQERVPVPPGNDELHTLALTFNEMIERLEKDFVRQRRFVSDASHELRTPVAAIRSLTDVALSQQNGTGEGQEAGKAGGAGGAGASSDEYLSTLRDVNAEAERLGHLINDLLALARTDENQLLLEREAVRLDLLAADVVATTEALASEKGIALEVKADQPATVIGDEVRLIQVMMNLIDNAIAYTNRGGKVLLSVEVRERSVYLIVQDSGIGIAQEHLEHIFERFYRVDAARSRAAGGSGLGLAIVDWIVRAHDGAISVESQVGKGTTFTVQLPLAG